MVKQADVSSEDDSAPIQISTKKNSVRHTNAKPTPKTKKRTTRVSNARQQQQQQINLEEALDAQIDEAALLQAFPTPTQQINLQESTRIVRVFPEQGIKVVYNTKIPVKSIRSPINKFVSAPHPLRRSVTVLYRKKATMSKLRS